MDNAACQQDLFRAAKRYAVRNASAAVRRNANTNYCRAQPCVAMATNRFDRINDIDEEEVVTEAEEAEGKELAGAHRSVSFFFEMLPAMPWSFTAYFEIYNITYWAKNEALINFLEHTCTNSESYD